MTKLQEFRLIIEESIERLERDFKSQHGDLHYYYLKGLDDAYKYCLDICKTLEAKEGNLIRDECDG